MDNKTQTVMVGLVAALIVPRVQKLTGVTLTTDDVAALMALTIGVWHGMGAMLNRFLPPAGPPPAQPEEKRK